MSQYRKRPIEVEAFQYTDLASAAGIQEWAATSDPPTEILSTRALAWDFNLGAWLRPNGKAVFAPYAEDSLIMPTLQASRERWVYATPGTWIIRGVQGEFYPCEHDIFLATYEAVS